MKKWISVLFAIATLATLSACSCNGDENTQTYVVRFEQDGQETIEKAVKEGSVLTDVPTPTPVEGYDVAWSVTDFSTVSNDTVVYAILTAKEYTITFTAEHGTPCMETQTITYEQPYTLAPATWGDYVFGGWLLEGEPMPNSGVWKITSDITLTATWKCTVAFVNEEETVQEVLVEYGGKLEESQTPQAPVQDGYTFAWDMAEDAITQACVQVNAIKTPNTYKIYYGYDFPTAPNGLTLDEATGKYYQNVRFGEEYTLYNVGVRNEATGFWTLNGERVSETGVYQTLGDTVLEIEWVSFVDDEFWTDNM